MRQSRHLGLTEYAKNPVNELVGLIALEYLKLCSEGEINIQYSQISRKNFFHYLFSWNNDKPKKVEDIRGSVLQVSSRTRLNNISCDCSSFVDAMWYIAHYIGKSKDNYKHSYSDKDAYGAAQLRKNPQRFVTGNPFTSFNFYNIKEYGFERKVGAVEMQPGDILIYHDTTSDPGEDGQYHAPIYQRNADTGQLETNGEYSSGHVQLYIGPGIWNGIQYNDLMIECGGSPGGLIESQGSITLSHMTNNGAWNSGGKIYFYSEDIQGKKAGSYLLRKIINKKSHPGQTIVPITNYTNTEIINNEEVPLYISTSYNNNNFRNNLFQIKQQANSENTEAWHLISSGQNIEIKYANNLQSQLFFNFEIVNTTQEMKNTYGYTDKLIIQIETDIDLSQCYCCLSSTSNLSFFNEEKLKKVCLNDAEPYIEQYQINENTTITAEYDMLDTLFALDNSDAFSISEIQYLDSMAGLVYDDGTPNYSDYLNNKQSKYIKQFIRENNYYYVEFDNAFEFNIITDQSQTRYDENGYQIKEYGLYFYFKNNNVLNILPINNIQITISTYYYKTDDKDTTTPSGG